MFQRLALKKLRSWAEKKNRKPLVLRGARQVGKTTLVETFAKDFEIFISLNLEEKENALGTRCPQLSGGSRLCI